MQRFQRIFLILRQTKMFGSALRLMLFIRYAAKDAGPPRLREDALRSDSNALYTQKDIDYTSEGHKFFSVAETSFSSSFRDSLSAEFIL